MASPRRTTLQLNHDVLRDVRVECLRLSIEAHKAVTAQNAQANGDVVIKLAGKMEAFVLGKP